MRWARTVIEHVAQMRIGCLRADLGPFHAVGIVHALDYFLAFQWPREGRPAAIRIVLVERAEQRLARHDIHVETRLLGVPEIVSVRRLSGGVLCHFEDRKSTRLHYS